VKFSARLTKPLFETITKQKAESKKEAGYHLLNTDLQESRDNQSGSKPFHLYLF